MNSSCLLFRRKLWQGIPSSSARRRKKLTYTDSRANGKEGWINITHGNKDEWSGFAELLANLIEKYAMVLNLDNCPELRCSSDGKETVNNLEHSKAGIENMGTA